MNGTRRGAAARPSKAGAERRGPAAACPNREPPADVVGGKARLGAVLRPSMSLRGSVSHRAWPEVSGICPARMALHRGASKPWH